MDLLQYDDIHSSRTTLKAVVFAVIVFFCAVLQTSFFSRIRIMGAVPDLVLAAVVGLAVFDGEQSGAVFGIWAGVIIDALGGLAISLNPVFYMLVGYFVGCASRFVFNRKFPAWIVISFAACVTKSAITLIQMAATNASINFLTAFSKVIAPEFIACFVISLPFYFIIKLCCRPFKKSVELE